MGNKNSGSIFRGKIGFDAKLQDEKSLAMLLHKHNDEGHVPFHMPGHKRSKSFEYLGGAQALDITEIAGFDNLHNANGVLRDAQQRAAKFFGVKESRFLVGGSTCGVLSAIRGTTHMGDSVLVARNCHKSVYNAVELCALTPYYVKPMYFEEYGFYGSVNPDDVEKQFEEHPDIKLVVIASPTYEGVISDIKAIAEICHKHDALLIVDEAHGSHLGLNKMFGKSARSLGADIVVNSMHKTLPALTQTAVLHICSDRVDVSRVDRSLGVFESSSPSYLLMSSIDECIRYLSGEGSKSLDSWADMVEKFRRSMSFSKHIKLFSGDREGRVFAYDKTKLVFLTVESNISGIEFERKLRKDFKIELEMSSVNYAIAMTGAGDGLNAYAALSEAVFNIENSIHDRRGLVNIKSILLPQKAFNPCEIDYLNTEFVNFEESVGLVSAENVWAYPPGCPIICKGEIIDKDFVRHVLYLYECGVNVQSERHLFPDSILTVVPESTVGSEDNQ